MTSLRSRTVAEYQMCPKCMKFSGDDWSQCAGSCPLPDSPHFSEPTASMFGDLIPHTAEEYQAEVRAQAAAFDRDVNQEIPF